LRSNFKIKPSLQFSSVLFLTLLFPSTTWAFQYTLSSAKNYFNYQEFSQEGSRLNKESGWLTDVGLSVRTNNESSHLLLGSLNYQFGHVQYDGQLQSGAKHLTKTSEDIFYLKSAYTYKISPEYRVGLSIGQSVWQRDILKKAGALGLYEEYTWKNISLYQQLRYENVNVDILMGVLVDGELSIDLSESGLGEVHIPLEDGLEAQLNVFSPLPYFLQWNSQVFISFIYREFPRSEDVKVGRYSFSEPRSKLGQFAIGLSVDWAN